MEMLNGRKVDTHCWICHSKKKDEAEEDLSYCVQCPRVFHFLCLGVKHRFSEQGLCPECRITSLDGTKLKDSITPKRLAKLLPHSLEKMRTSAPLLERFRYSEKQTQDLIFPVDLSQLFQKIEEQQYVTTAAFLSDAKWILHNLNILPAVSRPLISNAKKFVSTCAAELLEIEACPDCYEHSYSYGDNPKWFCELCSVMHTLVWAKVKGYPYWPAKVLKVIDGVADLRFFGSHEKAKLNVPGKWCYLLSRESPNLSVPQYTHFKPALEELDLYIANFTRKYGPVVFHVLEQQYYPGSDNICLKQVTTKRERSTNRSRPRSKKQNTVSLPIKNKVQVVSTDRFAEENKGSIIHDSNCSVGSDQSETTVTSTVKPQRKQRPSIKSNKTTVSEVNSVPAVANVSSTSNKSVRSNAVGHPECYPMSFQGTLERVLEKPCTYSLSGGSSTSTGASIAQVVSSSSSVVDKMKKIDCNSHVERTKLQSPENVVDQHNSVSHATSNSVDVNVQSVDHDCSVPLNIRVNSNTETVRLLPEVNSADGEDLTMSEGTSVNGGNTDVLAVDYVPAVPSERVVLAVPETRDDESARTFSGEIYSDDMFQIEEEPPYQENQNEFTLDQGTTENREPMLSQRPQPYIVNVPVTSSSCCYCVHIPAQHAHDPPEGQVLCTLPLPEGLDLKRYQEKVSLIFRELVEEIWHDYVNAPNIQNIIYRLHQDLENLKARHKRETEEATVNMDTILKGMERKKTEAVEAMRKMKEMEKEEAIKEIKKKQWCQNCGKEAMFYCCGKNTCCDHPCQKAHWLIETTSGVQANSVDEQQLSDSSVINTQRHQVCSSGDQSSSCQKTCGKQSSGIHPAVMSNKSQTNPTSCQQHSVRPCFQQHRVYPASVTTPNGVSPSTSFVKIHHVASEAERTLSGDASSMEASHYTQHCEIGRPGGYQM